MKKYILLVVLFAFLVSACGSTTSSEPMTDREIAEQVIKDFYTAIDEGQYDEAYQLLSLEHKNKTTAETFILHLQYHMTSVKIKSIEPYDGAVETERCKRFHVILDERVTQGAVETQLQEEEWVAVVKEGKEWKLNPSYYGLGKDSCSNFE